MKTYQIMHKNKIVAEISEHGIVHIFDVQFMPYGLYLEEGTEGDFDDCFNNLVNFYAWLASRILTLDRKYAKEILNSIGATQATTDKERALFAIKYKALSLTDVFWIREKGDNISFEKINLFDNHLSNAFIDVSLRGRQLTVTGTEFDADIATAGLYPKAWVRTEEGFVLYKDGGADTVKKEYLASQVASCFEVPQVSYKLKKYAGKYVTESKIITSKERSIVSVSDWNIMLINQDKDFISEAIALDKQGYYMMNIIDYLVGNTDRHWANWGVLVNNRTNKPIRLYDLMDFNKSFEAYTNLRGGICQTAHVPISQQEAAAKAVQAIGFNMIKEPEESWFAEGHKGKYKVLRARIEYLKSVCR